MSEGVSKENILSLAMTNELYHGSSGAAIGVVGDVRVASIGISLDPSAMSVAGIQPGSFFMIPDTGGSFIGVLVEVYAVENAVVASGEILGTVSIDLRQVEAGSHRAPKVGTPVYIASKEQIKLVSEAGAANPGQVSLALASLPNDDSVTISYSPNRLFGRHLAILGASGSGKSWTAAQIITECAQFRSKVILLDATGEYHSLRDGVRHLYIGDDPSPPVFAQPVSIPYFELNESDLFAIFQPKGQSQAAMLRSAMESLRIARLEPSLAIDGAIHKSYRSKVEFLEIAREYASELQDPRALFDIRHLCAQIRHECVHAQQSPVEPLYWGGHSAIDYGLCVPLINRIEDILSLPSLAPIFDPKEESSLFDEIVRFLQDPSISILRISLQYLSFSHNGREIVANAIGRYLMDAARLSIFRSKPLLVVVDEAHQFLQNILLTEDQSFPLDAFGLMAKEGRKYALNVCLITQRPRDIPEDLLSQMGTMLIHRLINQHDLSIVERAAGGAHARLAASLPTLRTGEAIVLGVDFPLPVKLKILQPSEPPDSQGPDYQTYWS